MLRLWSDVQIKRCGYLSLGYTHPPALLGRPRVPPPLHRHLETNQARTVQHYSTSLNNINGHLLFRSIISRFTHKNLSDESLDCPLWCIFFKVTIVWEQALRWHSVFFSSHEELPQVLTGTVLKRSPECTYITIRRKILCQNHDVQVIIFIVTN